MSGMTSHEKQGLRKSDHIQQDGDPECGSPLSLQLPVPRCGSRRSSFRQAMAASIDVAAAREQCTRERPHTTDGTAHRTSSPDKDSPDELNIYDQVAESLRILEGATPSSPSSSPARIGGSRTHTPNKRADDELNNWVHRRTRAIEGASDRRDVRLIHNGTMKPLVPYYCGFQVIKGGRGTPFANIDECDTLKTSDQVTPFTQRLRKAHKIYARPVWQEAYT